jgi:hypothetical protein
MNLAPSSVKTRRRTAVWSRSTLMWVQWFAIIAPASIMAQFPSKWPFIPPPGPLYPLLPVDPAYRSPSNAPGQILLDGIVKNIRLFHGSSDEEADWHVYIDPAFSTSRTLQSYLAARGINAPIAALDPIYSEVMVTDRHRRTWFDEFYYSGDVTRIYRLSKPGSAHAAWDLGLIAMNDQGVTHDFSTYSRLVADGGRAYLQGPFVQDDAHDQEVTIEIHPLESMAFAMDETLRTLAAKYGEPGWPARYV